MRRSQILALTLIITATLSGCAQKEPAQPPLPNGLLLSLAVLESGPSGPVPQPAQLGILTHDGDAWSYRALSDPDSNVFHKAMVFEPAGGPPAILTAAGTRAMVKLWAPDGSSRTLWEQDFGGKFSRMRDLEAADINGDGHTDIVVATHDQGVVAVLYGDGAGGFEPTQLDAEPNTFVHEVEVGDLDGDGVLEVYATPSLPNKLDGTPQPGYVTRYVPAAGEGRVVVADLGDRHAKEILVDDVDGDGTDELYVSVEAVAGGRVQVLRYDAGTDPAEGLLIATLDDTLTRFLTAGDVDGDGVKEMVAAASKSGLWLLRPGDDPRAEWSIESIDRNSGGFEHAAILTDLDGDGIDELYVANDDDGEINRYVWVDGTPQRELLYTHPEGLSGFTWNLMPAPISLIPGE
ncbi:MAG TPA: VCBS repeat-containing protein [Candidatus Sulfomarinibacteraceae bacterium]|nr:VCBS repeat-containing protein [Candidatus Sulfomarinibacteraceae bacterium]